MSNRQPEEKRTRRRASTEAGIPPEPQKSTKFARGTRDSLQPSTGRTPSRVIARLDDTVRDDELDTDELKLVDAPDTVGIDPDDPTISGDALDALDLSGDAASIDAHMLELARRRFGIAEFRPGP